MWQTLSQPKQWTGFKCADWCWKNRNNPPPRLKVRGMLISRPTHTSKNSQNFIMSGRPKQRSRKYRARRLINSEQFWDLIFDLIRKGQNLPAISKALDVPYRTLWGWINESEENRQRYDEAKKSRM